MGLVDTIRGGPLRCGVAMSCAAGALNLECVPEFSYSSGPPLLTPHTLRHLLQTSRLVPCRECRTSPPSRNSPIVGDQVRPPVLGADAVERGTVPAVVRST